MIARDRSSLRRSRLLAWLTTACVMAALIALGMSRIDVAWVGGELAHATGGWVALSVILMAGAFFSRGESWYAAIRIAVPDRPVDRRVVTRALLIGMAGSTVAPGRLGEAARAWLVARHYGGTRRSLGTVAGTVLSQTLLNVLGLTILAVFALSGSAIPAATWVRSDWPQRCPSG